MAMILWLIIVILCLMSFTNFLGETGKATTSTSCPLRSQMNLKGPPGIPGRMGPAGLGR